MQRLATHEQPAAGRDFGVNEIWLQLVLATQDVFSGVLMR